MSTTRQMMYQKMQDRGDLVKAAGELLSAGKVDEWQGKQEELKGLNREIEALEQQVQAEENFGSEETGKSIISLGAQYKTETQEEKDVKSFLEAARAGFPTAKGAGEQMQEGVGADGGYAVPTTIITKIRELRNTMPSLIGDVDAVTVDTPTGKEAYQTRSAVSPFVTVAEAAKMANKLKAPQFSMLEWSLDVKYGYLPVTNRLLRHADHSLYRKIIKWLALSETVTANTSILSVIHSGVGSSFTDLDGLTDAWLGLGIDFRNSSKLITNEDGVKWLSHLKDKNGRGLLSPNPTDTSKMQLAVGASVLPIKELPNKVLTTSTTKIPFIVGDLKEGCRYFMGEKLRLQALREATIGGVNAAEQDLTFIKGELEDDVVAKDSAAFVNGYIDTAAVGP